MIKKFSIDKISRLFILKSLMTSLMTRSDVAGPNGRMTDGTNVCLCATTVQWVTPRARPCTNMLKRLALHVLQVVATVSVHNNWNFVALLWLPANVNWVYVFSEVWQKRNFPNFNVKQQMSRISKQATKLQIISNVN